MYKDLFNEIGGQVDELRIACERQEVYYKTIISTHEVTIGQQALELNNLKQDSLRVQGNLAIAGRAERDNAQEAWDIVDEQVLEIKNLLMDVKKLQDEQVVLDIPRHVLTDDSLILQYTGVIEASDNPFPGDTTQVKKLDEIPRLVSQLTEAQEIVSGNVNTILHLQEQLKEMDEYAQEGWDLAETNSLEIKNLENDCKNHLAYGGDSYMWDTKASGRGMVEYPFNPEGETPTEDTLFPGNATPEPYPHTNPIREVPVSGKVKVKND